MKRMTTYIRLAVVLLVTSAGYRVGALETDQDSGWVVQTKTYNNWIAVPNPYPAGSATLDDTLVSDDFGFKITPGNYKVTINGGNLDDGGTVGGITASPGSSCGYPASISGAVGSSDVSITPDGRHLALHVTAIDNSTCRALYGWIDVSITWKARCNGGCSQNSCAWGEPDVKNSCVDFSMGLGTDAYQQSAGQLLVNAQSPDLSLATPNSIQVFLGATAERINDANGVLRQVRTSQLLADVVVSNSFCYSVYFYAPINFSAVKLNGLYVPTGPPYNVITVQNPDASADSYNRLRINTTSDYGNRQYDYNWLAGAQTWELITGGGLRTETRSEDWNGTHTILTETNVVLNPDSTVAFKQIETYQVFPWGETNLIQRVVDPDGDWPQTNTWTFYTNAGTDGGNYRHLKQITAPSGYWEQYSYDTLGRMTKKRAQFEDASMSVPDSQCRVTANTFTGGNTIAEQITIENLLGQEIARSYRLDSPGKVDNYVCQTRGAAINASDNLLTTTTSLTSGPFQGYPALTKNPDGTMSVYQYATNAAGLTTTVWVGAPDASGANVVDGAKTVTVVDLGGNAVSNATYDIASNLLLSSVVTLQRDELGRPTLIQYNDGTTATTDYGCCGVELQTDRQGITTSFTYDDLKRVSTTTRAGITTIYTYNANGDTLTTTRQGTNGSQMLQNVSVYNAAGQLRASTNALNDGTTYSQSLDANGDTVKTTTYPDGSTRIETYYQDGQLRSVTGTAAASPARYEYGVEIPSGEYFSRAYTKEIKLNAGGSDTGEWIKTYTDMVGRAYKTVYPSASGTPASQSFYNNQGQFYKQVDPDGVTTLYQYNRRGNLAFTATDMNGNGLIDFAGIDRIAFTTNDVITAHDTTVRRTRTYVWPTNNVNAFCLVSTVETSADGLQTWSIIYNNGMGITNYSQTVYNPATATTVVANIAPDGSATVTTNQLGRLISTTQEDANDAQIGQTIYGYDPQGRPNIVTDVRNGTTTLYFNNADQIVATLTPSPDGLQAGQLTTNVLDSMGRVLQTILPDHTRVTNVYYPNGLLAETCGSRTYPVGYSYDSQGRLKTMTNWSDFAAQSGARVTTWNYDPYRGWLANKVYAGNTPGPAYTHTPAGRLLTRAWVRGITATYSYNPAGEVSGVTYSDSSPSITYGYDRLGRQTSISSGAMVCNLAYDGAGDLLSESWSGGLLNGLSVTNGYNSELRRTALAALQSNNPFIQQSFEYDAASRLSTVSTEDGGQGTLSASYSYLENSPLVSQIVFANNGVLRMTASEQYDYLNRLTVISSIGSGGVPPAISFGYQYNQANQRIGCTSADDSYWVYQYDNLGQVVCGKKYWSGGAPVAGQQFTYSFDDIGNRRSTARGGDAAGSGLRVANYTNDLLNRISSREVPGYVNILGSAHPNATVTVNMERACRYGSYFSDELSRDNSSSALWVSLTNLAVLNDGSNPDIIAGNVGCIFLPRTPEVFSYDADGNLTGDGRWTYTWDAENRLVRMVSARAVGPAERIDYGYDWMGRRINKRVWDNTAGTGTPVLDERYVYDGWNLIAILDPQSSLVESFVWGNDLSGSQRGAGGVGGLLEVSNGGTNCFVAYDGNGNVAALINAADGTMAANYEYSPFGELIRSTGPMAKANPFRFSTKYQDDESDLVYYGYRYYNASTGRWPNRDPLGEEGSVNLYAFVRNRPINFYDPDGLQECCGCGPDNTAGLDAALQEASRRFNAASVYAKVKGCLYMFIIPNKAMSAWDLSFTDGGSGNCQGTITVKGGCYNPWDVNYALYGRGAKLCKVFFVSAKSEAWLYKMTIKAIENILSGDHPGGLYGTPDSVFEWSPQVSGWMKYGYDGTVPPNEHKSCAPCSKVGNVTLDSWPW